MARAQFQKGQKVWVECVGAWAQIEQVQPVWAKGFDEPVRVTYDVGLGRDFAASELFLPSEDPAAADRVDDVIEGDEVHDLVGAELVDHVQVEVCDGVLGRLCEGYRHGVLLG